jgi:hypothetical protein
MKLFQTIAYSLTITLLACIVNGLCCGLYVTLVQYDGSGPGVILLVTFFSGFFAAPGLLVFWLCFYIWTINGKKGQPLFRALVVLAAGIALGGSLLFCWLFWHELPLPIPVAVFAAVLASIISVFLHRGTLVSLFEPAKKLSHV